jgi:hypothetical protein
LKLLWLLAYAAAQEVNAEKGILMKCEKKLLVLTLSLACCLSLTAIEEYSPEKRDHKVKHYLADYHYRTAPLLPVDLTAFYLSPDSPQSITFKLNNQYQWAKIQNIAYNIYDYYGGKFSSGTVKVIAGKLKLDITLPQGYYEVVFPKYGESFGICSFPPHKGNRDPFFGMGSYFTFYVRHQFRESLIKNLARCGISSVREVCKWDDLNPQMGKWRRQGLLKVGNQVVKRHERLRALLKKHDIKLLEMCGSAPKWMRLAENSEYPVNLINLEKSWNRWAGRWETYWDCFQIWNEPNHDGHKGNVTEFSSLVKTLAWAGQQQKVKVTNGGFSFFDGNYIEQCKLNGMMDSISYLSLHIYDNAELIPQILKKYRKLVPDKELWVTETSKGFYRKTLHSKRPKLSSELVNCLDNVRNVIECKANGVSRYYPFSLISWPTDKHQLTKRKFYANGCLDYHYTPLRYMAVYAQAVRMLSGKEYLGEIPVKDNSLESLKVFADSREAVVILTASKHSNQMAYRFKPALKKFRIEGIDGRQLKAKNRFIPVKDGITYVIMDLNQFEKDFLKQVKHQKNNEKKFKVTLPTALSPIILQPSFNVTGKYIITKNYLKINKSLKKFNLKIKINNLSSNEKTIRLDSNSSASFKIFPPQKTVVVPSRGVIEQEYSVVINTKTVTDVINECQIAFSGTDDKGLKILPLNFAVRITSHDLADYREVAGKITKVDLNNLKKWDRKHIIKNGIMRIFLSPENNLRIQAKFKKYKNIRTWAAPRYPFDKYGSIMNSKSIILVRGKLKNTDNNIQLLMYEADGTRYETRQPINDKSNKGWQIMPVYFSDFQRTRGSFDENQNLDLNQVKKFAVGILCPHGGEMKENELLISDFYIIN